jgi:hypothetical protein
LIVATEKDCPDLLVQGKIDAATCDDFYFKNTQAEYRNMEIEKHLICNETLQLMVPQGHRLYDKPLVCYEDFADEPLIVESDSPSMLYWLNNLEEGYSVSLNIKYAFDKATLDHIRYKLHTVELKRKNSVLNDLYYEKTMFPGYRSIVVKDVYSTRSLYMWNLKERHQKIQPLLDSLKKFYYQPSENVYSLRALGDKNNH